jgi:hypothetical protein
MYVGRPVDWLVASRAFFCLTTSFPWSAQYTQTTLGAVQVYWTCPNCRHRIHWTILQPGSYRSVRRGCPRRNIRRLSSSRLASSGLRNATTREDFFFVWGMPVAHPAYRIGCCRDRISVAVKDFSFQPFRACGEEFSGGAVRQYCVLVINSLRILALGQ